MIARVNYHRFKQYGWFHRYDPDVLIFIEGLDLDPQDPVVGGPALKALDILVTKLKQNNFWDKYHAIWPILPTSLEDTRFNLKDPTKFKLTYPAGMGFATTGITGDGVQHATTGFIMDDEVTLGNLAIEGYVRTNISSGSVLMGALTFATAFTQQLQPRSLDFNNFTISVFDQFGTTDSRGFWVASDNGTIQRLFLDGIKVISDASGAIGLSEDEMFIMSSNFGGFPFGGSLLSHAQFGIREQLSDADELILYNIWQEYQTNVITGGRQI